jgi:hypothetical protein
MNAGSASTRRWKGIRGLHALDDGLDQRPPHARDGLGPIAAVHDDLGQ